MPEPSASTNRDLETAREASVELTKGIFAAVPGGIVHVTIDGAIRAANAEALRLLGLSYDELTQRYTQDFEPETIFEDGSICAASDYPVTKALSTGEPQPAVTIGVRRPDGGLSWCIFRAVPVKDPTSNATTGAVVTFLDITGRISVENTLRRSEAKLKAIVTSAPNIIFTTNRDARFTFMNRTQADIASDVDTNSVVGQSMFDWVNARDHDMLREKIRRVIEDKETVEYEVAGLDDVDPNFYMTRLAPVVEAGVVVAIAGVVTSMTEHKRAELERVRLLAQLHEAQRLEALGRLAGGVAHDFNNLLTVIRGNVDLLLHKAAEGPATNRAREIADATTRAAALTRQLLAFGRQQPLSPCVLDLASVVEGVAPMLRRLVGEHVELVLELGRVCRVRADLRELERVVVNLVMNAQDAMPTGGVCTMRVRDVELSAGEVEGAAAGTWVELDVSDTGVGMDDATIARIFEPFFTTKEIGRGSGLGLATVHGIVKQSGGTVVVSTSPGAGSTFRVLLPALTEAADEENTAPSSGEPAPASGPTGEGRVILLVEDEPRVRFVTKRLLEAEGYRVMDVGSPEEAVELADDVVSTIDLLLTDVVMPKMGGPTVAQRLRERAPGMKVVFMSGHVRESLGPLPRDAVFVGKPFDRATICAKLRKALQAS